jgi:BASS family bile acid:Na+ symporter
MLKKVIKGFTSLLPVWTVILGLIGYFKPNYLTVFKPYIDWMFAFTMLGIGAVLNYEDFVSIIKRPYLILLGSLSQFGIMPLTGYFLAKLLNLPKELALGVILTGSVPGAMASNVISYLAGADVAYSISLTTTSTLLAPILTPAFTYLLAKAFFKIEFWAMFKSIIIMVVLPLILGFIIKNIFKQKIKEFDYFFAAFSTIFIAFICGLVIALNRNYIEKVSMLVFISVFLHNSIGLLGGYYSGFLYSLNEKQRRTLSIEVGMQNAGLGAVLALKHFSEKSALPSALFATWCVITASVLAQIWKNKK